MIGGAIAIPFTGGLSSAAVVGGMGLTIGTISISTAELAIILGAGLGLVGLCKGYKVIFKDDGSVELTPNNFK